MEFAYTIGGGAPHIKKYIVDGGVTMNAGVVAQANMETADAEGVIPVTTTACVSSLGIAVDTASSTDAQVSSGDNAGYVSLIINPDAVFRAKLSGGATEDTSLSIVSAAQAASTTGTTVTGATDEFTVWGYSGANAGIVRRCTAAATVVLAFPYDIAALDEFLQTSTVFGEVTQWPTLSTNLTQIDATAAVAATNDNFIVVEQKLRDEARDGRNNSYAYLLAASHAFLSSGTLAT